MTKAEVGKLVAQAWQRRGWRAAEALNGTHSIVNEWGLSVLEAHIPRYGMPAIESDDIGEHLEFIANAVEALISLDIENQELREQLAKRKAHAKT